MSDAMRRARFAMLVAVVLSGLAGCAGTRPALAPGQSFPVFFTNAAVVPDASGLAVVDQAADWARRHESQPITVTGYADPRAPRAEIARLSTQRADEVAALLEDHGISPSRIKRAVGDEALVGLSGLGNRRVDISIGL